METDQNPVLNFSGKREIPVNVGNFSHKKNLKTFLIARGVGNSVGNNLSGLLGNSVSYRKMVSRAGLEPATR